MAESGSENGLSWIERARRLAAYHAEAVDFVARVGQGLPAAPGDARAVRELWAEADRLDAMVCSLLDEMNRELLGGSGEMGATRGAAIRPLTFEEEALFYECSWLLEWGQGSTVKVDLAVEPRTMFFDANVYALTTEEKINLPHPIIESELKDGLVDAYVAEATYGDVPKALEIPEYEQ